MGSTQRDHSPFFGNYMRPGQVIHTPSSQPGQPTGSHLSYPPTLRHQDNSPNSVGGESAWRSSWRGDMAPDGPRLLYSPQVHANRMGGPSLGQNTDSVHGAIAQILAEVKQLSSRMTSLEEEVQRITNIDQLINRLDGIESRLSIVEGAIAEGNKTHPTTGGASRSVVSDHPLLKVS